MDETTQLDIWLVAMQRMQEAGKQINASNRKLLEQIRDAARGLSHHPSASKIMELAETLLAADDLAESEHWALDESGEHLQERTFTAEQRKAMVDKGWALPDGGYPIETKGDLRNAVSAFGRAGNPAAVKVHIMKRAKAMSAMDMLPEDWMDGMKEATEMSWEEIESRVRAAIQTRFGVVEMTGMMDSPPSMHRRYVPIVATYQDRVIYRLEEKSFEVAYTLKEDGAVELGEPSEVVLAYQPVSESGVADTVVFIEAVKEDGKPTGREWEVMLITAGLSANGRYYPAATLKKAAPLFEGAAAFADHATEAERRIRPERSVREKVGQFTNVRYVKESAGGRTLEGLRARFVLVDRALRETLLEAYEAGLRDFLGFSIDAVGKVEPKEVGGKMVKWVESIFRVNSVDVVTSAAAGGAFERLVASNSGSEVTMTPEEMAALVKAQVTEVLTASQAEQTASVTTAVKETVAPVTQALTEAQAAIEQTKAELEALKESQRIVQTESLVERELAKVRLSDSGKQRIRESMAATAKARAVEENEITARIQEDVSYEAALIGQFVRPLSLPVSIQTGDAPADQWTKGFQGMMLSQAQDGVRPFRDLREAYARWVGQEYMDVDLLKMWDAFGGKYDSHLHHKRIQESLTTASWDSVFADNLYVLMIREYRSLEKYGRWRMLVSNVENVPDFRTRHWVRVGGYADLGTVAEQATYPTLTSPADEEIGYTITKYGGLDDMTMEMLADERGLAKVRTIPTAMARSAARTLFKAVVNAMTTDNPTMDYDSTALYTSHNNSGTTALSVAGLDAVDTAMREQTAYGESSEILGELNAPKTLIVPNELRNRAKRILHPTDAYAYGLNSTPDAETALDPGQYKDSGIEVLVADHFTDATDWFAVADPKQVPTCVVGFFQGQEEPEIFVQDNATVGSVFNADKISYKVRHIWGVEVLDHRSFYRQVVA